MSNGSGGGGGGGGAICTNTPTMAKQQQSNKKNYLRDDNLNHPRVGQGTMVIVPANEFINPWKELSIPRIFVFIK